LAGFPAAITIKHKHRHWQINLIDFTLPWIFAEDTPAGSILAQSSRRNTSLELEMQIRRILLLSGPERKGVAAGLC
jgi:hypothetical protein